MSRCQALLIASLLSGAICVGCASANHTIRSEALRYSTTTLSLVDQDVHMARAGNTAENSERELPVSLYVMREIIVFPLYAVTTLLIATGDWLEYERNSGKVRQDPSYHLSAQHCAREPIVRY